MTRASVSYCVECGERIAGAGIVVRNDEDFCGRCAGATPPKPAELPAVGLSPQPGSAPAPQAAGGTTRRRRAGQSTRSLPAPRRQPSPQLVLMLGATGVGLLAGTLGYFALGGERPPAQPAEVVAPAPPTLAPPPPPPPAPHPPVPKPDLEIEPQQPGSESPPGSERAPPDPDPAAPLGHLIGNRGSMRLHRSGCQLGNRVAARNREVFGPGEAERALARGYTWCGACGGAGSTR